MYGKPRKHKLSPLEGQIMWAVEETGLNLPALVATMAAHFRPDGAATLLGQIEDALRRLHGLGFLQADLATGPDRVRFPDPWTPVEFDRVYHILKGVELLPDNRGATGDYNCSVSLTEAGRAAVWG